MVVCAVSCGSQSCRSARHCVQLCDRRASGTLPQSRSSCRRSGAAWRWSHQPSRHLQMFPAWMACCSSWARPDNLPGKLRNCHDTCCSLGWLILLSHWRKRCYIDRCPNASICLPHLHHSAATSRQPDLILPSCCDVPHLHTSDAHAGTIVLGKKTHDRHTHAQP